MCAQMTTTADEDPITILAVDDEQMILELLKAILSRAGYRLLMASGGEEALALSRNFPGRIDVLLSDCSMPGMSGLELASALETERPDLEPLLISGQSDEIIPPRYGFLRKPFGPAQLYRAIANVLQQGSQEGALAKVQAMA